MEAHALTTTDGGRFKPRILRPDRGVCTEGSLPVVGPEHDLPSGSTRRELVLGTGVESGKVKRDPQDRSRPYRARNKIPQDHPKVGPGAKRHQGAAAVGKVDGLHATGMPAQAHCHGRSAGRSQAIAGGR